MPQNVYVGRFAPSPTGLIHLGVARTLLVAWLDARANRGKILLRIEDIDRDRSRDHFKDHLRRDLEWLGLDWDGEPTVQSDRSAQYQAALLALDALDRTYPCTCSRKEILLSSSAPHEDQPANGEERRYPGRCRVASMRQPGRAASIRLKTAPGDVVVHTDRRHGTLRQDVHAMVGDFVLRRAEGMWAYQLAVTVDDLHQGVTCIVRGRDLLDSTPRQILLRRLLSPLSPPIESLHVPVALGSDGKRLAKRDGAISIADRRALGETSEQVIGTLASTLGLVPNGARIQAAELISGWDPSRIPTQDSPLLA